MKFWSVDRLEKLSSKIFLGDYSQTDTTVTRHFHLVRGKEERMSQTQIQISHGVSWEEQVLDLVHELVHALAFEKIDPYDAALTPELYILKRIEGPGGEKEALFEECLVAEEWLGRTHPLFSRCEQLGVLDPSESWVSQFYQVGAQGKAELLEVLQEAHLLPLSEKPPVLFSSSSRIAYPVALYREFQVMNRTACVSSLKRLHVWKMAPFLFENWIAPFLSGLTCFLESRCWAFLAVPDAITKVD